MELKVTGDISPATVREAQEEKAHNESAVYSSEEVSREERLSSDNEQDSSPDIGSDQQSLHAKQVQTSAIVLVSSQNSSTPRIDKKERLRHRILGGKVEMADRKTTLVRGISIETSAWLFGVRIKAAAGFYDDDATLRGFPMRTLRNLLHSVSKRPNKYRFLARNLLRQSERRLTHEKYGTLVFMTEHDYEPQNVGGCLCLRNGKELKRAVRGERNDFQKGPGSVSPFFVCSLFDFSYSRFHYAYTPRKFSEDAQADCQIAKEREIEGRRTNQRIVGKKKINGNRQDADIPRPFRVHEHSRPRHTEAGASVKKIRGTPEWQTCLQRFRERFDAVREYDIQRRTRLELNDGTPATLDRWEMTLRRREAAGVLSPYAVAEELPQIDVSRPMVEKPLTPELKQSLCFYRNNSTTSEIYAEAATGETSVQSDELIGALSDDDSLCLQVLFEDSSSSAGMHHDALDCKSADSSMFGGFFSHLWTSAMHFFRSNGETITAHSSTAVPPPPPSLLSIERAAAVPVARTERAVNEGDIFQFENNQQDSVSQGLEGLAICASGASKEAWAATQDLLSQCLAKSEEMVCGLTNALRLIATKQEGDEEKVSEKQEGDEEKVSEKQEGDEEKVSEKQISNEEEVSEKQISNEEEVSESLMSKLLWWLTIL